MKKTLILVAALLLPALALAGANETPGRNGKPHKFSSFHANEYEFGSRDRLIFQTIVVGNQHYAQGATYADGGYKDLNPESAGLWNFLEFCGEGAADVMLFTGHGEEGVGTVIVEYPDSIGGQAVGETHRDSIYDYYKDLWGEDEIKKVDYRKSYGICITQHFYTRFFQTPNAFAWWASCYSEELEMVGRKEARCYVGYSDKVTSAKCYCDERYILSRMDGQSGQQYRPLEKAEKGVDDNCPDPKYHTFCYALGKTNTVLSPSVIGNAPTGIVCGITDGYVKFDTSMDTKVPPDAAAICYGDGFLINQAWAGDDKLTFTVIPTSDYPTIRYHAKEAFCRSVADRARLDGNTWPGPQNALGANRDDYVWYTYCPGAQVPVKVDDPSEPFTPRTPGYSVPVSTGVTNHTTGVKTVTVNLWDTKGWIGEPPKTFDIPPESFFDVLWEVEIPAGALPGGLDSLFVTVTGDFPADEGFSVFDVRSYVEAELLGNHLVLPGAGMELLLRLSNYSEVPAQIDGLVLSCAEPLIFAPEFTSLMLEAGESFDLRVMCDLPPTEPDGAVYEVEVEALLDGRSTSLGTLTLVSGLPVSVEFLDSSQLVAGKAGAPLMLELSNDSPLPWMLGFGATDSHGFPVVTPPEMYVDPGGILPLDLFVDIPADPALVGEEGLITLEVYDFDMGIVSRRILIPYVIGNPLYVDGLEGPAEPFYAGTGDGPFEWEFMLHNLSDETLEGEIRLEFEGYLGIEPIALTPGLASFATFPVPVDPTLAPGLYEAVLEATSIGGLGDFVMDLPIYVHTPVMGTVPRMVYNAEPGEEMEIPILIENLRPGTPMDVMVDHFDAEGWVQSSTEHPFSLPPGGSVEDVILISVPAGRVADEDSIWVQLDMLDDFGQPLSMIEQTLLVILDEAVGAPEDTPPARDRLDANYPNPFNPATLVRFQLKETAPATLAVYDLGGRRVATLVSGILEPGVHERRWNGRDDRGRELASGIYLIRLETPDGTWSRKAVLVR